MMTGADGWPIVRVMAKPTSTDVTYRDPVPVFVNLAQMVSAREREASESGLQITLIMINATFLVAGDEAEKLRRVLRQFSDRFEPIQTSADEGERD